MTQETASAGAQASTASVAVQGTGDSFFAPRATFHAVCYDADGNEKWSETAENIVTKDGKIDLLDKYFSGSSYTATWYCLLLSSTPTVAALNTISSHAWTEVGGTNAPAYTITGGSATLRAPLAFSGATVVSTNNAQKTTSSAAAFTFTSGGTIGGMGTTSVQTKDSTSAQVLYNAVAFSGGDRAVVTNDVVNVSVTYTIT